MRGGRTLYLTILTEQASEAAEVVGPQPNLYYENLSLYVHTDASFSDVINWRKDLVALGIAYNLLIYTNDRDFWPQGGSYVERFDGDGKLQSAHNQRPQVDATRRELFHQQIPTLTTRDIDRMANCVLAHDQWENQSENGKLYRMLDLIGAAP